MSELRQESRSVLTLIPLDDYGLGCGALLAIAMSFLSNFLAPFDFSSSARQVAEALISGCMLHSNNTRNLNQNIDKGGTTARCWRHPSRLE
jgi:hypothetical protein